MQIVICAFRMCIICFNLNVFKIFKCMSVCLENDVTDLLTIIGTSCGMSDEKINSVKHCISIENLKKTMTFISEFKWCQYW